MSVKIVISQCCEIIYEAAFWPDDFTFTIYFPKNWRTFGKIAGSEFFYSKFQWALMSFLKVALKQKVFLPSALLLFDYPTFYIHLIFSRSVISFFLGWDQHKNTFLDLVKFNYMHGTWYFSLFWWTKRMYRELISLCF